ncbi:MAG: C40 family peptidase [Gaiellaceae bacterium]
MPSRLRSLLLAFALAAFVFASLASSTEAALDGPTPRKRERVQPKPTVGQRAAKIALRAVGVPYRWGGASPSGGFDCSGLVHWAYGRLGIGLPHSSYALYGLGRRVSRSRMKPGDMVFFSGLGHMGMYIGGGRMVHAPSSGRLVEVVKLGGSHYGSRLVGARRIVTR